MRKGKNTGPFVRDDLGHAWYYDADAQRMICVIDDSKPKSQRGYHCTSLADGVRALNEMKYITGHDEPDTDTGTLTGRVA